MKLTAKTLSVVLHPLLFPSYALLLLLITNPNTFGYFGQKIHMVWMAMVFILTFIFPTVWLLMMKKLEMIDSFEMSSAKERILPYVATATFYLWTAWMFKPNVNMKIPTNPLIFYLLLGACLSIFVAFFINNFSKISLHAVGTGALLGLVLHLTKISTFDLRGLLLLSIVVCGVIGSARLYLNAHTTEELVTGYTVGFTGQVIAFTLLPFIFQF
jgi:hypothetical protein